MQSQFDQIDLTIAKKIVADGQGEDYAENKAFFDGDHWQNATGWVGPTLPPGHAKLATYLANVERGFVFDNVVKEAVGRHVGGVLGISPTVTAVSKQATVDQSLIDEATGIWDAWWDNHATDDNFLHDAARCMLLGKHAVLRGLIPPVMIVDGKVPTLTIEEAAKTIQIAVHDENTANVWRYPVSYQDVAVYLYKKGDGIFEQFGTEEAELSYLADDGTTILRTTESALVAVPLSGILTMYKVARPTLLGASARSLQKSLNMTLTMWRRNLELAGFRERTFLNAEFPTELVDDGNGGKREVPAPMNVGAGAANFIKGMSYTDVDGSVKVATPGLIYGDPVPVDSFDTSADKLYGLMLGEAHQRHAILSGSNSLSGESRIQAQAEFEADLNLTADALTDALEWLFRFVLGMTAYLSGQPGRYAEIKAEVTVTVRPTPMSVDERNFWLSAANDRKISDKTFRSRVGIDNSDAEEEQIATEDAAISQGNAAQQGAFAGQATSVLEQLRATAQQVTLQP